MGGREGEGVKHDGGKLPWHLLPTDAAREVVKVLQFGAAKYGAHNWERGMDWSRVYDALQRHMTAWLDGEDNDPETGLPHLAHAATNALFLLAYQLRGAGTDDRPTRQVPAFTNWVTDTAQRREAAIDRYLRRQLAETEEILRDRSAAP